jgi:hypothetical protein
VETDGQKWINKFYNYCEFEILTAVAMQYTAFCDATPCSPVEDYRCFEGTYYLHLHGEELSQANNQLEASRTLLGVYFLLVSLRGLLFDSEDGVRMFF